MGFNRKSRKLKANISNKIGRNTLTKFVKPKTNNVKEIRKSNNEIKFIVSITEIEDR